ncbi:MAG: FIG01964566: Predicted membrane protein, hemolysin III homolog [uncultured Nocardioidaceae bacterium]|uniref:FIG01964566: Predicted membrane protein, hemolysin III homolog n=1 Tax=uncultured Nocardioidaceae bacterium TaxID=253824 RepID=A0A6J4KWW0_9ACTN|nr:MAG: FIG01964566: Predicted membrane protein, hemolysin III homolog [uncultured Nocardioidaceae bacterium]
MADEPDAGDRLASATAEVSARLEHVIEEIKPRLRGWLHAATLPLIAVAGIVLIALSPRPAIAWASAVYAVCAVLLFGVSALYHTGTWSPAAHARLKRFDHANIFLLIAGSYTPYTMLLLDRSDATALLSLVWVGAAAGVLFRVFWIGAPRWLYVPIYLALGWAAVFWTPQFAASASTTVLILLVVGGALYSIGGIVYGLQRPNPSPTWFGFHEVFHSLTIAAFVVHYVGISIAAYSS